MRVGDGEALGAAGWDALVLAQPDGNLLQSWRWGALQARFGWQVTRLVFDEGESGVCSLQRTRTLLPGGFTHYAPRGPLVPRPQRAEVVEALGRRVFAEGGVALSLEPQAAAGDSWGGLLLELGFQPGSPIQPGATQLLDLRPDLEAIRAGFKPKTRYNLALAERKGVSVVRTRDVRPFFRLSQETARRQGIHLPGAAYYQALLDCFETEEHARLYLALHAGTPLAGIIVVRFGETATYLFGGSTLARRELMANYPLHWQAIRDFRELGCTRYDWWGIPEDPSPDHPWFGLYRFKTGFGGETVRYVGLFERALRPARLHWERRLKKLKARLRRARVG